MWKYDEKRFHVRALKPMAEENCLTLCIYIHVAGAARQGRDIFRACFPVQPFISIRERFEKSGDTVRQAGVGNGYIFEQCRVFGKPKRDFTFFPPVLTSRQE